MSDSKEKENAAPLPPPPSSLANVKRSLLEKKRALSALGTSLFHPPAYEDYVGTPHAIKRKRARAAAKRHSALVEAAEVGSSPGEVDAASKIDWPSEVRAELAGNVGPDDVRARRQELAELHIGARF